MRILNQEEILQFVRRHDLIGAIENAFRIYESGEFEMPVRAHVDYQGKTLLSMPCFTNQSFGAKLVSLVPDNPQKGLPVLFGVVVLNDGESGLPLALMNGAAVTALRTSAVGSLSIKYMAADDAKNIGVIGAGVQGYYQSLFACSVRKFENLFLYDIDETRVKGLTEKLSKELPGIQIHPSVSAADVAERSDVIITVSNTETPLFPNDPALFSKKHFVGIGSYKPEMREYPEALFKNLETVFIDTDHAFHETGDIITPLEEGWIRREQILPFSKVVTQKVTRYTNDNQLTFFKSVGMALFDIVAADLIYKKALEEQVGTEVEI